MRRDERRRAADLSEVRDVHFGEDEQQTDALHKPVRPAGHAWHGPTAVSGVQCSAHTMNTIRRITCVRAHTKLVWGECLSAIKRVKAAVGRACASRGEGQVCGGEELLETSRRMNERAVLDTVAAYDVDVEG
jgi:hypothetical protein